MVARDVTLEAIQRASGCNQDNEPDDWGVPCRAGCICNEVANGRGLLRRADVLRVVDECAAPDGIYYARQPDRIQGWNRAQGTIRVRLETLAPAPGPWRPIREAPIDGTTVWVYATAAHGLPGLQGPAAYHPDAGWCVDELREATHWVPLSAVSLPPPGFDPGS